MRKLFLILFLLLPKLTFASFSTPIAHTIAGSTDGGNVTSDAINTSTATLIIIGVADLDTFTSTLTDSKSNTWTYTGTQYAEVANARVKIYYSINPTVGSGHTFTITGNGYPTIAVVAFAGVKVSSPLDIQNGASALASATLATGSITPSEDNELVISFMSGGSSSGPYSIDSGFTILDGNTLSGGLHFGGALAYKVQTSAAAVNPTWTQGGLNGIAATILSFKAAANSFNYTTPLTVTSNTALLPASQTDFPLLISFTNTNFKSVSNGGHVQSELGYDIRPYSDSALTTTLPCFQLEKYDATTGELILWVKDPTISIGQVIHLGHGNLALVSDGSSTCTWDSNYIGVFHLNEAAFTGTVVGNSVTGTNTGTGAGTVPTTTTGKISAGMSTGASGYITLPGTPYIAGAITYQTWINPNAIPASNGGVILMRYSNNGGGAPNADNSNFYIRTDGKLSTNVHTINSGGGYVGYDGTGSTTLTTSTWYHLAITFDSTNGLVGYVNGVSDGTGATDGSALFTNQAGTFYFGNESSTTFHLNAIFDEVHVSGIARSADWIKAEYNNQNDPTTFLAIGTEASSSGLNSKLLMGVGK